MRKKKVKQTHITLVYDSSLYLKDNTFDGKVRTVMTKYNGESDGSGMGFGQRDITMTIPTAQFKSFEKEVCKLHSSVECLVNHID